MTVRERTMKLCGHFQDLSTKSPMTSGSSARSLPASACSTWRSAARGESTFSDLDSGQLDTLRETLDGHGLKVSSIGSPIGKISIDDEFAPHLERMRHAVEVAKLSTRRTSGSSPSSFPRAPTPTSP